MKVIFALLVVTVIACGKKDESNKSSSTPTAVKNESIVNVFESIDGSPLHGLHELDFTGLVEGQQSDIGLEEMCDGTYGNSGQVNGADPSRAIITGTLSSGVLQIGHTKYVGASDPVCRGISKESYTYEIERDILTLCMVNYPYCAQYQVVK